MFQDQSSKSTPANSYYVPMVVEQDGRGRGSAAGGGAGVGRGAGGGGAGQPAERMGVS